MPHETDLQADALLLAIVEQTGDLRQAFTVLCARVPPAALCGETFEQALGRAVSRLLRQAAPARLPIWHHLADGGS